MKISVFYFKSIEKFLIQQPQKDSVKSIVAELAV